MQFKLTEVYNTRYFYKTTYKDLNYLFNSCLEIANGSTYAFHAGSKTIADIFDCFRNGTFVEFDFDGAALTSDVTCTLPSYITKGLHFIDSKNSLRSSIFKENERRLSIDKSDYTVMPPFTVDMNVNSYITEMRKDATYTIPLVDSNVYIPLAIMTTMVRPSIKFSLDNKGIDLLTFMANRLTPAILEKYDEFYQVTPEGILITSISDINVQRKGKVSLTDALTEANFVPTVFGTKRIFEDPDFRPIFVDCNRILTRYRKTRKSKLSDYFS